jgi:2-phospho-L-lactate transferase/gluconeogenesis factor (CofD/UPF0052 family)
MGGSFPCKAKIAVFGGGRGIASILEALNRTNRVELTVLVNAYDDGLSTGRLRKFIKGMLGPSDVRKNITTLMSQEDRSQRALRRLLEFRFSEKACRDEAIIALQWLLTGHGTCNIGEIQSIYGDLRYSVLQSLQKYCETFLAYESHAFLQGDLFDYSDCSLGNIFFCGCFLQHRDFNQTTEHLAALCETRGRILNATDGANHVLVAIKANGQFLKDESAIVSVQAANPIREVFLLPAYLTLADEEYLESLDLHARIHFLRERSIRPAINDDAAAALREADAIIYGPGTQNSSLLPSYLTVGVAEAIAVNTHAAKYLITNIHHDHDTYGLKANEFVDAFSFYMSRKGELESRLDAWVTHCLIQENDITDINRKLSSNYVRIERERLGGILQLAHLNDWESEGGKHSGGQIADEIVASLPNPRAYGLLPVRHKISIVVPVLNESQSLGRVLDRLISLDFATFGMTKEVIVVDGGSTDTSIDVATKIDGVRVYRSQGGRGAAMILGSEKARGDIVVFFPSDGEYEEDDILSVADPIVDNRFRVVFGSRAIKCLNVNDRLRHIYGRNRVGYLMSKYGGMLVSIACLLLHNRYITDPFTTLKAFDKKVLKSLRLRSPSCALEGEIIAKLAEAGEYILEVPVRYSPRTRSEGKKMNAWSGLQTLGAILRFRSSGTKDRTEVVMGSEVQLDPTAFLGDEASAWEHPEIAREHQKSA